MRSSTLCNFHCKFYYDDQMKEDEMGGTCSAREKDEKCVHIFGWNTWRIETTGKT
jgi:hypothetical protein